MQCVMWEEALSRQADATVALSKPGALLTFHVMQRAKKQLPSHAAWVDALR